MLLPIITALLARTTALSLGATGEVRVTPHDQFSSTIGVHGCKIDVNRLAYWPYWPDCSGMCINLTHGSRSRTVLHLDVSGSAYDISFDTYQYLAYGSSATASPAIMNPDRNGALDIDYKIVDMSECMDIITSETGRLSFMALSPNQVNRCINEGDNWVAQNYELRNINDLQCHYGLDEPCTLDLVTGTANCPSGAGMKVAPLSPPQPVIDLRYPCGVKATAGLAPPAPTQCVTTTRDPVA
ncbi:hypothetical protein F5883DRAFT_424806 [Diaporthe sp. PMI_573]|nr:hypothetical protein F5883DRAFT_441122 [Diaporthaceae sp. PMI_573]KAH8761693.1 hypothetical protein F5883DRAFT_424806 [Diaporthaceae sp. PMI_573]